MLACFDFLFVEMEYEFSFECSDVELACFDFLFVEMEDEFSFECLFLEE